MKIKSLLVFGSMALVGVAFMSCSKDIAFDSEAAAQKVVAEYDANFVKKYGAIDPNQTWDFTTMTPIYSLPSGTATRASETRASVSLESTSTIEIDKDIIKWMRQNMKPGQNHSQVGAPFASAMSRNSFIIAPIYQGVATYFWELWVNIGGKEYKIWQKYETLQYKGADGEMYDLTTNGVPEDALGVVAPSYTFKATEGDQLFFFLKVWNNDSAHTSDGSGSWILSSLNNHNMRALENVPGLTMPANVPSDYFAYIIGCEDGSDNDFEDLAFLYFGPPMINVEEVDVNETKRYMMEDLGDTDDFDFNDVVVDVSNVCKKKITWKENFTTGKMEYAGETIVEGTQHQEAIVRAAGGIYDFTLKIGDTYWTKSEKLNASSMLNTGWQGAPINFSEVLDRFDVTGWIPEDNNISLTVYLPNGDQSLDAPVQTITFPRKGTAPKMIAVDPTWNWMQERVGVPGPSDPKPWWHY